jgi:hypothetical protein
MPAFTVELSFEYRSTYRVEAQDADQAIAAAEARHHRTHNGAAVPEALAGVMVACLGDVEFADYLDTRVFDANGNEID